MWGINITIFYIWWSTKSDIPLHAPDAYGCPGWSPLFFDSHWMCLIILRLFFLCMYCFLLFCSLFFFYNFLLFETFQLILFLSLFWNFSLEVAIFELGILLWFKLLLVGILCFKVSHFDYSYTCIFFPNISWAPDLFALFDFSSCVFPWYLKLNVFELILI